MTLRYLLPLSSEEQLSHGLDEPQPYAMADRVRYSELDVLNHVNNKAYVDWFESARISHFTQNHSACWGQAPQPRTVLRNADIHYVREMLAGESYVVTARVTAFRNTSYSIEQQIWAGDLRARLRGVMVMLHPETNAKYPLPEAVRRVFRDLDGATDETA